MRVLARYLFWMIGQEKKWLTAGLLLSIVTAICMIGLLSLSGWFIAASAIAGISVTSMYAFNYMLPATGVRFFALTRIASRYGERVISHDATLRLLAKLRVTTYQHLEPLAPAYLLKYRVGDLLNRVITDINTLDNVYLKLLTPVIVTTVISVLLLFYLHFFSAVVAWVTFLILLIAVLLLPAIAYYLSKQPGQRLVMAHSSLRQQIIIACQYLSELLCLNQWQTQAMNIEQSHRHWLRLQQQLLLVKATTQALLQIVTGIAIISALCLAIPLVNQQQLASANLALLVLTLLVAFEVIAVLPLAWQFLPQTIRAALRLQDIAQQQPAVIFNTTNHVDMNQPTIQLQQVSFSQQNQVIIKQLNMSIPFQSHIYLTGETGCGKTTLAYLLNRFYDVSSGNILLNDKNIKNISEQTLRETICYIEQRPHLFNTTIRENLLLAKPNASDVELYHALQLVELDQLVCKLPQGIDTWVNETGSRFSGGQIRRLCIARALLRDNPIMIFDEPGESLDIALAQRILSNIHQYLADRTVIIITHQLNLIATHKVIHLTNQAESNYYHCHKQ